MMLWPSRASSPATVELSTPPLMATAIGFSGMGWCQRRNLAQMRDRIHHCLNERVHLLLGIRPAEREPDARTRPLRRQPDGKQHVRGLDRPARTGRAARDSESPQIESDDHGLAL